jgi:hypothetical protein
MIPVRIVIAHRIRGAPAEQAAAPLMKKALLCIAVSFAIVAYFAHAQAENPGPTTRPLLGGAPNGPSTVTVNIPPIQIPPTQVVVAPDPIHTIDLPLMNYNGATVRVNVRMISAVVPYTMDMNGTPHTGSAVYCWPADIWYVSTDVTSLTTQLAAAGWGSGSPLVVTGQQVSQQRAPETPKPYTNPVNQNQPRPQTQPR